MDLGQFHNRIKPEDVLPGFSEEGRLRVAGPGASAELSSTPATSDMFHNFCLRNSFATNMSFDFINIKLLRVWIYPYCIVQHRFRTAPLARLSELGAQNELHPKAHFTAGKAKMCMPFPSHRTRGRTENPGLPRSGTSALPPPQHVQVQGERSTGGF